LPDDYFAGISGQKAKAICAIFFSGKAKNNSEYLFVVDYRFEGKFNH